jgi:hypothetical protein
MELSSISTPAGNLGAGTYGFVIEEESASRREYVIGTLSGSTLTFTHRDLSPTDATTTDASGDTDRQSHRKGASIKLTNFPILLLIQRVLDGTDQLDADAPLEYDATASISGNNMLATKAYVDAVVNGGTVTFDNQIFTGDAGETVADGELVYLKEADGEWYLVDATDTATFQNVRIGIAQGAGTDGAAISGGVLVSGIDNTISYTAGQLYYATDVAGALGTSAGTNTFVVGIGDANNKLVLLPYYLPTPTEKDALAGSSGTPSSTNPYKTKYDARGSIKAVTAGATINGATLPVPVYQNDSDNEFYACDANDTSAMKYLGFAITNGTNGASMDVQFTGIVSGFTGLTEGEKYYVQDAVGTIGNSAGTYEILAGVAISETELLIQKGRRRAGGTLGALGTASSSEAITCGFRPSVVRLYGVGDDDGNGNFSVAMGVWINGTFYDCALGHFGATGAEGTTFAMYASNSGDYMSLSIGSITDTGFTISWTETGSYDGNETIIWEAEGEL